MKKMTKVGDVVDERQVYSPPCVVRISDLNRGEGQQMCYPTGSGDAVECETGSSAGTCFGNGNSPNGNCLFVGSGNGCVGA